VLQEVMLIDSYSCSCPVLVMRLCTCCEPANGFCMILCLFVYSSGFCFCVCVY